MAVQQKKQLHPKVKITEVPRTRPVRIAARRQRKLMAIIASGMYNVVLLHNIAIPLFKKNVLFVCTCAYDESRT
jgi:hypothetical protein